MGGCAGSGRPHCGYNFAASLRICTEHSEGGPLIMATAVEVSDLKAWFGRTEALHGINMAVEQAHATAVIGPSGCGKSTFIRCLNRMHETNPDARAEGEVQVKDMDVYADGVAPVDVRRRIGMVFQKANPFPSMSIYDNVAAGLKLNGFRNRK